MTDFTFGYDHGYLAGYQAGQEAAAAMLEQRDDRLARRIVALLLQHDHNGQLVQSVIRTTNGGGIPRQANGTDINWAALLSGAA